MEPKGSIGVETTVEWIKKNMIEPYTENLERPLTEYEIRVQRALERLPIPHWYRQYSKPFKILKRHQPADSSSSTSPWKSTKGKQSSKGTKQPSSSASKSRGQKNSQRKVQSATLDRSKHDFDEAYYSSCQSPEEEEDTLKSNSSSSSSSSSSSIYDSELAKDKELWSLLEDLANVKTPEKRCRSFTLPRISPTRKIDNINIVLPSPGSQKDSDSRAGDEPKSSRYLTTLLHDMSLEPGLESSQTIEPASNYATLFFADLQPEGLQSCVYMHAEMTDVSSCEEPGEEELEWQSEQPEQHEQQLEEDTRSTIIGSTTSLNTRFLQSENKSRMLERIVQRKRRSKSSLIQNIISELERSLVLRADSGSSCSGAEHQPDSGGFVRDLVSALEHNDEGEPAKELVYVTDSELARSFSSLSCARDDSSVDEEPVRPSYSYPEEQEEEQEEEEEEEEESEDEGELWISVCKQEEAEEEPRSALLELQPPPRVEMAYPGRQLARTSSQIAGRASSGSFAYASGRCSPGLSPIRASPSTSACKLSSASSVPDSGYSDRSSGRSSRPQYCRAARRGPGSSCDSSDWEAGRSSSPSTRAHSPAISSSESDGIDDTPKRASRPYASRSIYV